MATNREANSGASAQKPWVSRTSRGVRGRPLYGRLGAMLAAYRSGDSTVAPFGMSSRTEIASVIDAHRRGAGESRGLCSRFVAPSLGSHG